MGRPFRLAIDQERTVRSRPKCGHEGQVRNSESDLTASSFFRGYDEFMGKHLANSLEFTRRLNAASPDQWHQVAQSLNWDNGTGALSRIVQKPKCDIGTGLLIFWLSEPLHNLAMLNPYADLSQRTLYIDSETLPLQISILRRWIRNEFVRSKIAFEGSDIKDYQRSRVAPIVPIAVLEEMAEPRQGKIVERGELDEGIPYNIVEAFNEANGFL